MLKSLPKKKFRKKRKKKKMFIEPTETVEMKWRLPTFPYEKQTNEVIINGKVLTTVNILQVPGKSTTGFNFIKEQPNIVSQDSTHKKIVQVQNSDLDMSNEAAQLDVDINTDEIIKVVRDDEAFEDQTEKVNIAQMHEYEQNNVNEINGFNDCEVENDNCCLDGSVDEESVMLEDFSSKHLSCYFTITARVIDFHRIISVKKRLGYPIVIKMSVNPKQIPPEDYSNPQSMYYSARDSFRRFLDISSCIEAQVEYQDVLLLPATCLEEMVIKEHSNEKLTLHTPPLPTLLEKITFGVQERFCILPSDELMLPLPNQTYFTNTRMLEKVKLAESDDNVEINVKFRCYSRFILMKILKFPFEVSIGVFPSHDTSRNSASSEYIPYPYPQITVFPQEISELDTLCKLVIPLKKVILDMRQGSRILVSVTCCSKPRACILRIELSRMFAKKTPDS